MDYADFPSMGISQSAIYIADDERRFSDNGLDWPMITVIGLPELLSGSSTLNITQFQKVQGVNGGTTGQLASALTYGSSNQEFFLSLQSITALNLFDINTSGTPVLNVTTVPISAVGFPPGASQPGTSNLINTTRAQETVLSPVWRNGSLWATQESADSSGANAVVRWYQIDPVAANVTQYGNLNGVGEAYYGALTVNDAGEVFMTYSTSSASQYASAAYSHRVASDPAGTMSTEAVYQSGQVPYQGSRWGDLSGMSIDPDQGSAWGLTEYATSNPPQGDYNFGTTLVKLLYQSPLASNSAFVNQQYLDFLDREADQDGLNGWDNQLNNGLSRPQIIDDLMGSAEFAEKGLFVAQAYLGILTRDADYGGFRGWLSWLENGGTEVNLVNSFLSSSEFQSNFGSDLDNGQFVTRMYENVLLRQPDSGGYNYFVGQLNGGQMTRAQVGLAFLQSSEFQNLTSSQHRVSISLLYFDMLRRQPDSGGFNGWVNALNSGTALTDVINGFLNSQEYSSRFQ